MPAVAEFEEVLDDYLGGRRSDRRRILVDVVDMLLAHRRACTTIQGPSLSELPIIERANASVRRLAAAICDERESVADQVRFGIALGGAAFPLTAGRTHRRGVPADRRGAARRTAGHHPRAPRA